MKEEQKGNRASKDKGSALSFTDEERLAMKERARELRASRKGSTDPAADERAVLAKIAEMPEPDRSMAERLHTLIRSVAASLSPRLWYGMPAYAKDGKVICFFQGAYKFKTRYSTFGFTDAAKLDDGNMWATSFALRDLTPAEEEYIADLIKKAVS